MGRRSDLAVHAVWSILERYPPIQPAGVSDLGGGYCALALDQRRQDHAGPAGICRDGRVGYLADAAVPAPQAADRVFPKLTGNTAPPGLCPAVRSNGAAVTCVETYNNVTSSSPRFDASRKEVSHVVHA